MEKVNNRENVSARNAGLFHLKREIPVIIFLLEEIYTLFVKKAIQRWQLYHDVNGTDVTPDILLSLCYNLPDVPVYT
jgi:hypothetical protein